MPWLQKDQVLFIHIPRCGGTSITKFHKVAYKARQGKHCVQRILMMYYFYRYGLLEQANFPLLTIESGIVVLQILIATFLYFFGPPGLPAPYIMWTLATCMFIMSSFILTAPIGMRYTWGRRLIIFIGQYILCRMIGDTEYMIGTNDKGFLFHLTAERALRYGYVTREEVEEKAFAIVRNPYSRVVSMFEYNKRFGESFEHFVKDFHKKCMEDYHKLRKVDSRFIYCHVLPMYEYTHLNGEKVVNCVIKQEDLKRFVATGWKDSGVPIPIQKALTGIPHANKRPRKVAWRDYYTQETVDMVIDMYEEDFEIFGYPKLIPGRPDLIPSKLAFEEPSNVDNSQSSNLSKSDLLLKEASEVTRGYNGHQSEENGKLEEGIYYAKRRVNGFELPLKKKPEEKKLDGKKRYIDSKLGYDEQPIGINEDLNEEEYKLAVS